MKLRDTHEFKILAAVIKAAASGRDIYYLPNVGNWGDGLIHKGQQQFFRLHNIQYKPLLRDDLLALSKAMPRSAKLSNSVLLSGGGGAWCTNWDGARTQLEKAAHLFSHVVVMPTSFELPPLDLPSGHVTYFRRDKQFSSEYIPESIFCHDMAFFVDPASVEGFSHLGSADPSKRVEHQYFLREDHEAHPLSFVKHIKNNLDLSQKANYLTGVAGFLSPISACNHVSTDRLHVGIASCLLDVECDLYPGNYFKSIAVYEASIKPNYDKVRLARWD
jgi:CDP-glycerol glycerophosphotransferase